MTEQEARKKYLASKGLECPFCGSKDIQAGETDTQDYMICRNVACDRCNKTWTDEYKLTGLTFDDEAFGPPVENSEEHLRKLICEGVNKGLSNTELVDWIFPPGVVLLMGNRKLVTSLISIIRESFQKIQLDNLMK